MIFRHEHSGGTTWVDLEQPTGDEIRSIMREFDIDEQLEEELLSPTPFPLVTAEGATTLLVLHFPMHSNEPETDDSRSQEIDFVIGKRFIVTVRYEVVVPLHHLRKLLETEDMVANETPLATDVLLEILFAHLYASVRDHTNHIADHLGRIEQYMFDGNENETIRSISNMSRQFLHLESALANQEEPLNRFLKLLSRERYFGSSFEERATRIGAERAQIARLVSTHRSGASELRETNSALLEVRQNTIMKTLTVINFIMLPLELVALVFSMHLLGEPLEQNPNAFWIVLSFMLLVTGSLALIFAKKRWIA